MKTAEEWADKCFDGFPQKGIINDIRDIQLDAMKEGMRRAVNVVCNGSLPPIWVSSGCAYRTQTDINKAILHAAEQLTEKDL
jgi:hypothetical protein